MDGEICTCTAAHSKNDTASSPLPDSKAIIEGAKNAAEALKNDPMVSEVFDTIKGVIVSPAEQVSENAYRTDILWLILTGLEAIMISFGVTSIIRRSIYSLMTFFGINIQYREYAKELKEMGLSSLKIFGAEFIWAAVSVIAAALIILVLMTLCRKNVVFSAAANMTATAFLPSSMLMTLAGLLSYVHIAAGIIAATAALISATVLGYVGVQKLGRFDSPPFWHYVVCMLLLNIVNMLMEKICLGQLMDELLNAIL